MFLGFDPKPKTFKLDSDTPGWKNELIVTCKIHGNGFIQIEKIECFVELFQIDVDITSKCIDGKALETLRAEIADWHIGEQYSNLRAIDSARLDRQNDNPNDAA